MPSFFWIVLALAICFVLAAEIHRWWKARIWREAFQAGKGRTVDPEKCSHCHLTLSNASARYCPRCGKGKDYSGPPAMFPRADMFAERDMWRERATDNLEALRKSADLASAAARNLPPWLSTSTNVATVRYDYCR